jgi:hypothetical protein
LRRQRNAERPRRHSHAERGNDQDSSRLAGCLREQARSHRGSGTSARFGSAGRLPSRAGSLPQGIRYIRQIRVGWQAAFASRLAPTGDPAHPPDSGRLAGRLREQARSHSGPVYTLRSSPLIRPSVSSPSAFDLDLPALYREAEWRCSSGEWRAAPFDAVEHAACRCQRSQPEGSVPGWIPERRNTEP